MADVQSLLERYVEALLQSGALRDPAVERVFRRVPRHRFIGRFYVGSEAAGWTPVDHDPDRPDPVHLEKIYSDAALITRLRDNLGTSSSSQPPLMAEMLQLLDVRPGMRVLEIGAGTGYNAALLAELTGDPSRVTTVDIQPEVVDETRERLARAGYEAVRVLCRDGFEGAPEWAPFDRVVATVGCPDVSPRWAEQLAPDGFMLIPLRHAGANPLIRVTHDGRPGSRELRGRIAGFSGFMAIQGALADPGYYDFSSVLDGPGDGEVERPLWPELSEPGRHRLGFWFYLGLCDPRTRVFRWISSYGLKDPSTGHTARLAEDRLVGDPALLDALDAHFAAWRALGAPQLHRWRMRFAPTKTPVAPAADVPDPQWTHTGPHYHRVTLL